MPRDTQRPVAKTAVTPPRPAKRVFAAPSREGLLVCAASLMPAYLFGLIALMNTLGLIGMVQGAFADDFDNSTAFWLHIGHGALSTGFSMLCCWLFLIRRPSAEPRGAGGRVGDVAAVAGTGVVLGISLAPRTTDDLLVIATAEALMTIGLIVMMVSLFSLGRSFGIMPRARGLVQRGVYRWVRHPIYLGEFLAFGGLTLMALSPLTLAVYTTFVALQVYRLVLEERTLTDAYPEYNIYRERTARLLPGVY